ncbi:MAG: phosphoribosylformylglycinamidine synthase [Clostridiales bacterium]|jgi:phosphoribosylformylglycinamidine synthase|nr:phosphoribosylformylglycinamidine synthase [Clostridiales bacterium]
MVKRIYIEKKPGFDSEAAHLLGGIRKDLLIEAAQGVRIVHCYDVQGLNEAEFAAASGAVFAEMAVDNISDELKTADADFVFGKQLLPGQFDQRADSAMQCIQIMTGRLPVVQYTKIHIVSGAALTEDDRAAILKYCINPIDSMQAGLEMPETLVLDLAAPADIENISIISKGDDEIAKMHGELGLAMSIADLAFVRDYFKNDEGREPTATEIAVIDTYWSDHCRHTTFHTEITDVAFQQGKHSEIFAKTYNEYLETRKRVYGDEAGKRPVTLMDMATLGMKALKKDGLLDDLDESEEVNAASITITVDVDGKDEEWLLMFKNETHNHPTEMEPFGGAATCLGGAIRDPLSGRSYVYQAMRVTGSGDPRRPIAETLPGKLPQRVITTGAAEGYSSYGNQIGLATGLVREIYHEGYVAKRMEIGAVVGAAKKENVIRKRPKSGDVVVLVGGRTGRDGIGGATGSSKEHGEHSLAACGAEVQKGNPVTQRKLQRLFRNPAAAKLILRCNDFGAGGVCVAIGELADSIEINLDAVRKKYEGLDGTELAISESQERMAVVVSSENAQIFMDLAADENLEAYKVAEITDTGRLVMKWRGKEIVNISREFLNTSGVRQQTKVKVAQPIFESAPEKTWPENLTDLNVASNKGLVEMFDSTVGAGTVLAPFGGKYQMTPAQAMAAKIPVPKGETNTASVMSFGFDPYLSSASPYHGAVYAVVESISRIVAAGADYRKARMSFQEYFERLRGAESWGKPFAALLGAFAAQMALGIPAIGGKDSMSGTFGDMHVPPTLVSFAIAAAKTENIISPEFKTAGNHIALLKTDYDENGLPDFEHLRRNYDLLHRLIAEKKVISAYAAGFGGIAAAVSKMAFGNKIGAEIDYGGDLFQSGMGCFVLEMADEAEGVQIIGKTKDNEILRINDKSMEMEEAIRAWTAPLEDVFPSVATKAERIEYVPPVYEAKSVIVAKNRVARPGVFIPVFPGSNCEWDMARCFEDAGAEAEIFVINNLTSEGLAESVAQMARRIGQAQIVAIPGGFSAGDEPEGSAKFISAVFRNEAIRDAVAELMQRREGLMIGICNGFQALLKLGLLQHGEIRPMTEDSPTLTYNAIGRHISGLVLTKVVSNKSPWFSGVDVGDIHRVAASHGQGRFAADVALAKRLFENGQVSTVYVDEAGEIAQNMPHNPNGSLFGIEGITSPDGRILGKMAHSERIGKGLYKNVQGNYDQKIFEAGVRYFV